MTACDLRVTWIVLLALTASINAQQSTSTHASIPSYDDPSVALVTSGLELASALANPYKSWAILNSSFGTDDSDWTTNITRTSNFTISGQPGLATSYPVLALNFVKAKILLDGPVALVFQHLVLQGFRSLPLTQSPGLDLLINPPADAGALVVVAEALLVLRICVPHTINQDQLLVNITRPAALPGKQTASSNVSQAGCTNTSLLPAAQAALVPYVSRCWPDAGMYGDIAVACSDVDSFGRATATHYSLQLLRTEFVCTEVMTAECVGRLGPLGCFLFMFPRTPPSPMPSPSPPTPPALPNSPPVAAAAAGGSSSGGSVGAIVGGVVGGVCGVTALLLLVLLLVLWRRKRRAGGQQEKQQQETCEGDATPGGVPEAAASGAQPAGKQQPPPLAGAGAGGAGAAAAAAGVQGVVSVRVKGAAAAAAGSSCEHSCSSTSACPHGDTGGAAGSQGAASSCLVLAEVADEPEAGGNQLQVQGVQQQQSHQQQQTQQPGSSGTEQQQQQRQGGNSGGQVPAAAPARLPSGVGACVLSGPDPDTASPLVVVTPLTPHRADLRLDVQCDREVQLLPVVRGSGSYGRVVEGLYDGQRVAVKLVMDVEEWSGPTEALVSSFAQEVEVLGRCCHPNVVRLLAACLTPPRLCLVMELMDSSLEALVHGRGRGAGLLPLTTVLHIASDIARGLAYLHPTIVHRDLKSANVLLSHTDRVRPLAKLTDFGLSRLRSTVLVTKNPEAGTPAYMAPEAFDANNYIITHKADIYALGVILWEMLTGSIPWEGCSMVAIAYSITVRHHRLPLSKLDSQRCPPKLRKLIHACWDPDPQRRPAAAELVKQLTLVLQMVQGESANGSNSGAMTPGSSSGGQAVQAPAPAAAAAVVAPNTAAPHAAAPAVIDALAAQQQQHCVAVAPSPPPPQQQPPTLAGN